MDTDIVDRILVLEQSAVSIVDTAKERSRIISTAAEHAAESKRAEILEQAQMQAAEIIAESKSTAEAHRARVLKQAEDQANDVKLNANENISNAVTYILDRVKPSI